MTSIVSQSLTHRVSGHVEQPHTLLLIGGVVLLVLLLPPVIYAYLSYAKFGLFKPSFYIPYEAFSAALRSGSAYALWSASLIVVNMTSGLLLSNMYTLTVAQLLLSVSLGVLIGLNLAAHGVLRRNCPATARTAETASATGTSLLATVAASSTGIVGCCGSALGGGVLALAGLSATSAVQIATWSPYMQSGLIVLFVVNYIRLRRRVRIS